MHVCLRFNLIMSAEILSNGLQYNYVHDNEFCIMLTLLVIFFLLYMCSCAHFIACSTGKWLHNQYLWVGDWNWLQNLGSCC